jgi:hypothetical protein
MKINKIYIAIYSVLSLFFITTGYLLKPTEQRITHAQYTEEVTYVEVGKEIPIDHKSLRKIYDYDSIELMNVIRNNHHGISFIEEQNDPVFVQTNRSEFIAKRHGLAIYLALLYKDDKLVHCINLGYHLQYIEYDENDDSWIALNQLNFISMLEENPKGKFYISEDINLKNRDRSIKTFSGILYNPYQYKITNVNIVQSKVNQGLFEFLDNAIIDGIIIEDSSIIRITDTGTPITYASNGFIASLAFGSFISNTHVQGNISYENARLTGGLVASSYYSLYRYVSFTGSIDKSSHVGGIIGYNLGYNEWIEPLKIRTYTHVNTIENAYVNAELSGFDANAFVGVNHHLIVLKMKSIYAVGSLNFEEKILYSPMSYFSGTTMFNSPSYRYAYTTYPRIEDLSEEDADEIIFITPELITSGTVLEGLEDFIFKHGDLPILPYWRIGS